MRPHFLTLVLWVCLWPGSLRASSPRFAIVLIDAQSESQYGEFPLDRRLIAQAVDRLADLKAKGVILKFFFDQAKEGAGDAALARAFSRVPVLLQARIDDSEASPNPFPTRCFFAGLPSRPALRAFSGSRGWIPLPLFAAGARDIWLTGGGELVGQFADHGLLDEVIVSIAPVTLGAGAPLLPRRIELRLDDVGRNGDFVSAKFSVVKT